MAVFNINDTQFQQEISAHEKVIVKYYADWCESCKLFAPKFNRLSEDVNFSAIHFVEVNVEENPHARKAAGADNLPFFATFKNGVFVEGSTTSKEEVVIGMMERL
jgi:thioredoxin 1